MKKSILTLAAIAAVATASGRTLSPAEALGRAIAAPDAPAGVSSMHAPARTVPVLTLNTDFNQPALYVINRSEGFVIVSADDTAAPLLAYSDEGTFDENNIPDNCRFWLNLYKEEIARAIEQGVAYEETAPATQRDPIAPICTTKWDQGAPYNDQCPKVGSTRTYTGCVATAMAQVIKARNYPAKGIGTYSYTWNGQSLSFDYANTTFDWANMLDSYPSAASGTIAQRKAVSTLMLACGIGVQMNYGTGASGAVSAVVPRCLRENFGFDNGVRFVDRACYSSEEWEQMLYNEIKNNGPAYYSGRAESGGHAFVADGYLDGYFHFNWGWSGMSDGYFRLNRLVPGSQGIGGNSEGFNDNQGMIIDLCLPKEGSQLPAPYWAADEPMQAYKTRNAVRVTGPWLNYTPYNTNGRLALEYRDANTGEVVYTKNSLQGANMQAGRGVNYFDAAIAGVADGKYRAYPVYVFNNVNYPVHTLTWDAGYIYIEKNGSDWTIETPRAGELSTSALELLSPFYPGKVFGLRLPYTYTGEKDMNIPLIPCLLNSEGRTVAQAEQLNAIFTPGQGSIEYSGSWLTSVSTGTYLLALVTEGGLGENGGTNYINLCEPVSITVETLPAGATVVRINSADWEIVDADNVNADNITVNATLNCIQGYYAGPVLARIYDTDPNYTIAEISSDNIYTSKGKVNITIKGQMLGAVPGKTYNMMLCQYNGSRLASGKPFTISAESGIENVIADENAPVEYFNLQGVKVENPAPGTLVVRRQGSKVEKVIIR